MRNVANEMDPRKPFDIVEMVRDILGVPPLVKGVERLKFVDEEWERLKRDSAHQMDMERRAGCCDMEGDSE